MRVIAGILVLAFLAVIVKASLVAFGTPDRKSARMDRTEQRALEPSRR